MFGLFFRMFYMFFESRGDKVSDPVVLWMSGGPGCSSELALFYENGPFQITNNLTLVWNEHGWDTVSNLIFIDQPIGTGFSYSSDIRDIRHDETGVSEDVYSFLQAFFEAHPEFRENELYITGESYAGHYVPAVTSRIHQGNKAGEGLLMNLKGFAIGNGLTDPEIQYKAYADYAVEMNLISEDIRDDLNKLYPACDLSIKMCGTSGKVTCVASFLVCNSIFNGLMAMIGTVNYYDIRKECSGRLCYDFSKMETYLNQQTVKDALGVGHRKFVSCNPLVYEMMLVDWMRNLEVGIPTLLEDGIKLLVYAGEYDLICNWLGNSRWVSEINWLGKQNYSMASSKPFLVLGEEAGIMTNFGPLTFLKVHDAGHMVPMDQPKSALEMIKRFTHGGLLEELPYDVIKQVVKDGGM
ncbi:hypothetical protein L7F22_055802 [Adiantum nelumboides]|nr:hypothetical protein [Adiantum nelumboides]